MAVLMLENARVLNRVIILGTRIKSGIYTRSGRYLAYISRGV